MNEINPKPALYLYFDEAGNYDFKTTGSKFFILTCGFMRRPFNNVHSEILGVKYDSLELGFDIDRFHASDDKQAARDRIFNIPAGHLDSYAVYAVSIRKSSLTEDMREPARLYLSAFRKPKPRWRQPENR